MDVILQVSELKFATDDGVLILDHVSFGVPREGAALLVGPPSSGKTLLLRLLLRELPPSGGQILLLGRNVARLSAHKVLQLRRRVGYMPEYPAVIGGRTVRDNLAFKLRALGIHSDEIPDLSVRALQLSGLEDDQEQHAGDLSPLRERQLALALALATEPPIVLCDDPLRDLQPEDQPAMVALLERVRRAGTALVLTGRRAEPLLPVLHIPPEGVLVNLRQEAVL